MLDMLKHLLGDIKVDDIAKTLTDLAESIESKPEPVATEPAKPEPKLATKGDLAVFELQKKLIARGAKITADGIMGPSTKQPLLLLAQSNYKNYSLKIKIVQIFA